MGFLHGQLRLGERDAAGRPVGSRCPGELASRCHRERKSGVDRPGGHRDVPRDGDEFGGHDQLCVDVRRRGHGDGRQSDARLRRTGDLFGRGDGDGCARAFCGVPGLRDRHDRVDRATGRVSHRDRCGSERLLRGFRLGR